MWKPATLVRVLAEQAGKQPGIITVALPLHAVAVGRDGVSALVRGRPGDRRGS
jgi:hypothetical protein